MVTGVQPTPHIVMLLLNNSSLGGAERRYAQIYEHLRRRNVAISLAINESLLRKLIQSGILSESIPDLVLKEWIGNVASYVFRMNDASRREIRSGRGIIRNIIRVAAFALGKLDYAIGSLNVAWWVLRRGPQVLHLILGGAYVALPLQIIRCAPPSVISVVSPNLRGMVGSGPGYGLYRLALRFAHIVDALTDSIRLALEQEGISAKRIRVSPGSSVDTGRFLPAAVKHPWVVFAGRLIPEKNPDQFVAVCALVHRRHPRAQFFILGDGPLHSEVQNLVKQHGMEPYTEMGWHDHVEAVFRHTLVFVSIQTMDNYPSQALLEAMSCGAAVVATDVGQTGKLVDETVGMRVEAKPEAVAEAVVHLLDNPEEAAAMGRRGRQRVLEEHSTEAYLDYLERVYRDLDHERTERHKA